VIDDNVRRRKEHVGDGTLGPHALGCASSEIAAAT
jgi:hypothetical protein